MVLIKKLLCKQNAQFVYKFVKANKENNIKIYALRKFHVKPFLKQKGYNLSALAKLMDMSFQRFDYHIKYRNDISYNFLQRLSDTLEMEVHELVNFIEVNDNNNYANK